MVRAMLRKNFQNFVATHGGAVAFLHNGLKVTKTVEAEFDFGKNSYGFALTPTADETFTISESFNHWILPINFLLVAPLSTVEY